MLLGMGCARSPAAIGCPRSPVARRREFKSFVIKKPMFSPADHIQNLREMHSYFQKLDLEVPFDESSFDEKCIQRGEEQKVDDDALCEDEFLDINRLPEIPKSFKYSYQRRMQSESSSFDDESISDLSSVSQREGDNYMEELSVEGGAYIVHYEDELHSLDSGDDSTSIYKAVRNHYTTNEITSESPPLPQTFARKIVQKEWDEVRNWMKDSPSYACARVYSEKNQSSRGDKKVYPLLLACIGQAPEDIILGLAKAWPIALKESSLDGKLPLHYICSFQATSSDLLQCILNPFKEGAAVTDVFGYLPIHYAVSKMMDYSLIYQLYSAHEKIYSEDSKRKLSVLDSHVYISVGMHLVSKKEFNEASSCFRKALQINEEIGGGKNNEMESDAMILLLLSTCKRKLKAFKEARVLAYNALQIKKHLQNVETAQALIEVGLIERKLRRFDRAFKHFSLAGSLLTKLGFAPESPKLLFLKKKTLATVRELVKAKKKKESRKKEIM